jgi:hypothetical protein
MFSLRAVSVGIMLLNKKYNLLNIFFFINLNVESCLEHCNSYDTKCKKYEYIAE